MPQLSLNPQCTAVLSMAMQAGIVAAYITDQAFLSRSSSALEHARKSGMSVIHVQVGFRPNLPEMNARNLLISAIHSLPQRLQLFQGANAAIHPTVAPVQHEVVFTKHRVSANCSESRQGRLSFSSPACSAERRSARHITSPKFLGYALTTPATPRPLR